MARLLCLAVLLCAWRHGAAQTNFPPLFVDGIHLDSVSFLELQAEDANLTIYSVEAEDPEGDPVSYYISPASLNSDRFQVDSVTGGVTTLPGVILDRETLTPDNRALTLLIRARDDQSHEVADPEFTLLIVLQDVNDQHPRISDLPTTVIFPEDTPRTSELYTVEATDGDSGANALVYYRLETNTTMFAVDSQTGVVTLLEDLDYDVAANRQHTITIVAEDQGDPSLSDSRTLTIVATDVDDLDPFFQPPSYSTSIFENITLGEVVVEVSALDGDRGVDEDVFYSLQDSGNELIGGELSFVIDNVTGELSVNVSLDRETHATYTLTVEATQVNDSSKVATATVSITILDINDNLPIFGEETYTTNVSESLDTGRTVLTVSATDRDDGTNAEFMYHLEDLQPNSTGLPFSIDSDGTISLTESLDFEETESYLFMVVAQEEVGGANGTALVWVFVDNENDLSPVFDPVQYNMTIAEGAEADAFIQRVVATDGDKGSFGELTYSLISGHFDDFYINTTADGGAVFTAEMLDYETRSSYTIGVQATDTPELGMEARTAATPAELAVQVININDNPPLFDRDNLTVTLDEETEAGTEVAVLVVTDGDGDDLTERTFSITRGNGGNFTFDPNSPNIIVTSVELDYDLNPDLRVQELTVVVNDTVFLDQITVTIELVDINDNTPMFENTSYQFSMLEEVAVGYEVGMVVAVDADSGTLGEVYYSISDNEKFSINSTTGVISTKGEVDREMQDSYSVTITATDLDQDVTARRTATVPVTITVLDINDNSPQFSPDTYDFSVRENTATVEFPVSASDEDAGTNGDVIYQFVSGNTNNAFIIDARSGEIVRNANLTLDREERDSYSIVVMAMDGGSPPNSATANITITILDENDEDPMFNRSAYTTSIDEDSRSDVIVLQVTATDRDTPANAMLEFSIVSVAGPDSTADPAPPSGTFTIETTSGNIRTQGTFDREAFEGPYVLVVVVADNGEGISRSGTAIVTVSLNDVNDNDPVFQPTTYAMTLMEELPAGQSVAMVMATDRDAGSNKELSYSISVVALNNIENQTTVASHFAVNSTTGEVVTAVSLDYEFVQRYMITVLATDGGDNERSSSATITVTVTDVNDHTPDFIAEPYTLTISEATLRNTRFSVLQVTDEDSGENSRLTFTADITSPLAVDEDTGELVVTQTLDYESNRSYTFTVNVSDNGASPRMASTMVSVMLLDVNDNPPVFQNTSYSATRPEQDYSTNNDVITTVSATDEDSGEFGEVTYELLSGNTQLFSLDSATGEVSVVADVDFEALFPPLDATEIEMQLVVQARDGGDPAMTASVTVTVTITDENDNSPEFQGTPYEAELRENSLAGEEVITVRAIDGDGNRNGVIRYSISDSVNFSIDDVTGIITTGMPNTSNSTLLYDFETQNSYTFTVTATDNGTSPRATDVGVTVTILDRNDNSPVITSVDPQTRTIPESASPSSSMPLTEITVSDEDSGENEEVDYQLSNDGGLFSVDSNGRIYLTGELDRETVDEYNITITATDRGQPRRSAESYFIVEVGDTNDNAPTFDQDTHTAVLLENVTQGHTVITLRVQDPDLRGLGGFTAGGDLTFGIIRGDATAFNLIITPLPNGWWEAAVQTNTLFDYEVGPRSYDLEVQARDGISPFFTGSTNLRVTILDVNDNPPSFSSPSYTLSAPENLPAGGVVGSVLATDPDGANNGNVTYTFADDATGPVLATFSLHPVTGVLDLLVSINFEGGPSSYDFSVVAMDSGVPAMSSSADVRVNIQDINEFAPMFTQDQYSGSVPENVGPSFVLQVSANDSESQSAIVYGIVTGSTDDFELNPNSGDLSTRGPLNREVVPQYVLTLQAVDGSGVDSRTSYTQVTVSVEDVNDNTPTFPFDSYSYLISEGSPPSTALTPSVMAEDPDEGTNGDIVYSLEPPTSASQPFTVDTSTGVVSLAADGQLDRETTPTYSFLLQAEDRGTLSRTGSIQLMVTLIDVNDLSPVFDQSDYSGSVAENSPPGVSVVTVTASDGDSTDTLRYEITAGDPEDQFSIDGLSGLILTGVEPLDRETQAGYTLTVTVADSDLRMDEVEVAVSITDRNDNRPVFSSPTYFRTHVENNPNDLVVATVMATDIDELENGNGRVNYAIVGGNSRGVFYIDASSGEVIAYAEMLDYETQQVHTLTIEATDQASPVNLRQFSTAVLTVDVEDSNDNRPLFSQALYRTTVTENAAMGTTVAIISATDGDSGTNGEITYSFFGAVTNVFSINSTTGVVTVTGVVNFEMGQDHELTVQARDRGNPQRSNTVTLQVQIINEEDENPRFPISFYTASVNEDVDPQTSVLTVVATDPDDVVGSGSLAYDIISSSNMNGYFRIDTLTGEISTARSLDRETVAVVDLQVVAMDTANHNGTATVQITIRDVNDNAPEFVSDSYTASLRENSVVGTTIIPFLGGNSTRVEAMDRDGPGLNSEVSYDKEGEDSDKFSVDKDTGIVTVAPGAVLDREEDDTLILVITAEDHGDPEMTSSVTITITLLDENDNPPTFVPQFGYAVRVAEDHAVDSVLHTAVAMDPDLLGGGEIMFRLATTSPLSKLSSFAINGTSGDITLLESLDREEDSLIVLTISAHDNGVPTLVASTSVQITVTDVNDNTPQFSQDTYIATVSEQLSVGASVVTVTADDPDIGTNGQVVYGVASSNTPFTVNQDTGEVTTTVALDFETVDRHTFTVEACDMGPDRNCSTAEVTVYVTDFNDETPLFDFPTYRTDLCHTQPPGEVFMWPAAIDRDSGSNSDLSFTLEDSTSGLVSVWPTTGRIYLARGVEAEEVGSEFTAVITVTDGGNPMLSSTARIEVQVLNCTNDTFRFRSPYFEIETNEFPGDGEGSTLSMFINTMPGTQSEVFFSPELEDNPFTQNFALLFVMDRADLDRESRDLYTLPIMSTSDNGDTAYATITVKILDLNDNIPQLQLSALSFTVSENTSAPIVVTTAMATDRDIGENAAIVYRFTTSSSFFTINNTTGVVATATELDRETLQEHQLAIQASDGDFVSETMTITVSVADVNDNRPDFSEDIYSISVVENSPAGTSLLTVVAEDRDEGSNADITFSIEGGDLSIFELDSRTGVVRTTQALDYETRSQYSLIVNAEDSGAPVLTSTVDINITVVDFNDHTPVFLNPITFTSISEGVAVGTVLTDFNVSDSDSGPRGELGVRFSIIAGNTDLFSVNEVSGILRTEATLDRDMGPVCRFVSIQATDSAGDNSLSNSTEIEVCLIDENDNCPNFTQPAFSGEVPEDEDLNQQLLLRVQATDADSDTTTNGAVVYGLLEDGGVFDIDPSTGFLSLSATLDKETTSRYDLIVEACDRGEEPCCANTTISVDVLDVNDNQPQILNVPVECVSVLETGRCGDVVQDVGDFVFTVNASDIDTMASGAVLFRPLQGTTSFSLSPSGVITIADILDFEDQQNHQLFISARDQGIPLSLTSETSILCVTIQDINDNPPVFSVGSYSVSQDEGTVPSSRLIQIIATDADTVAENAMVYYSISSGNTSVFTINEETGELFLEVELDCEATRSYSLTVLANNSLSPCPMTAEIPVLITVIDVNDNRPVFSQQTYHETILENVDVSSTVVTVTATDNDKDSPNNDLLYRLELGSGSNPFHLDQNTGVLTVQNSLDAETQSGPNYTLTVVVEDKGVPIMSSTATVIVTVLDVNDEPPVFTQGTYSVDVEEEQSPTVLPLVSLSYTDADTLPENQASRVTVTNVVGRLPDGSTFALGTGAALFSVSEDNTLQLLSTLDREVIVSYDITVNIENIVPCQRAGGAECSSTATVVVTATDVNDNEPIFTPRSYSGEVSVTASPGTSVLTVLAEDPDTGDFGEVRYRLADSLGGRFRIDEVTGVILTRGNFENLDGQRLTLTVTAYDSLGGAGSLDSSATVNLVVLNDFQRISVLFTCGVSTIVESEQTVINIVADVSGLDIQVENYVDHSTDIATNFIFHATDPVTNEIVDFDEFFRRLQEGGQSKEAELIARLSAICPVQKITAFANVDSYSYPDALDAQSIVIFVLCVILVVGALTSLVLAIRQRWVALHDTRSKLLADVFYGSPGSTSLVENIQQENYQLEQLEMRGGNRQNPMFVQPYDNWQGVDASGPESTGDISSMNRDNPLYESQEIRMEMFADVSDEEEGDEADDAELLAAALKDEEEPEDTSVTAI